MSRRQHSFLFSSLLFVYSSTLCEDIEQTLELATYSISVTYIFIIYIYVCVWFLMLCQTVRKFALLNICRALCALPCAPLFSNPSWSTGG